MNKILCSIYFKIDIICHTPPDIPINTSISTRPNQLHSILHTRQSAIQVRPPIYQLYSYCIFYISYRMKPTWCTICSQCTCISSILFITSTVSDLSRSIIRRKNCRSAYALHILNCKHEYGTNEDTMVLLKHIDKPSLLLPYKQLHIQLFHHNNELIPEQHPNEQNPMFQLLYNQYHTSYPT
jgi:hypothetical protein